MARRLTPTQRKRRHRPRQLELRPRTWGGRRDGAGRPSLGRVPRVARPPVASRFPVHVTLKLDESLPNLRTKPLFGVIEPCLKQGKERDGFRLVHYSVQGHHLHLIVEAQSAHDLGAGIKGLSVRIARRLNATLGRTGRVFAERYFARVLKTPRQTRAAIAYVLLNARRHASQRGQKLARSWMDPCSSGRFFDGWRAQSTPPADEQPTVAAPRTWLLRAGWRRWRLIRIDEIPGSDP